MVLHFLSEEQECTIMSCQKLPYNQISPHVLNLPPTDFPSTLCYLYCCMYSFTSLLVPPLSILHCKLRIYGHVWNIVTLGVSYIAIASLHAWQ